MQGVGHGPNPRSQKDILLDRMAVAFLKADVGRSFGTEIFGDLDRAWEGMAEESREHFREAVRPLLPFVLDHHRRAAVMEVDLHTWWPRTVHQAVRVLYAFMDDAALAEFASLSPEQAIEFHHGLGRSIRNTMGLWMGNAELVADCGLAGEDLHEQADGGSQVILRALIRYVRKMRALHQAPRLLEAAWHRLQADMTLVSEPNREGIEEIAEGIRELLGELTATAGEGNHA